MKDRKLRPAFTLLELVFVIVVVGILAAIAIPKLAATRDDAIVTKARATVGALRSAIAMERQKRILRGNFSNITATQAQNLLEYSMGNRWRVSGNNFVFTDSHGNTCTFTLRSNKLLKGSCSVPGLNDL